MTVWLVRAGRHGVQESLALEKGLSVVGWDELPDLAGVTSREAQEELVRATYPDAGKGRVKNWTTQLWAFRDRIQPGDLVVLPLHAQSAVAIGEITGPYVYRPDLPSDARHTRTTNWLRTDIARSKFDQDLLYSLGAFLTVCQVKRNNAEERIKAILGGQPAPVLAVDESDEEKPLLDLEQAAKDDLVAFITQKFKGHELTRLIDEILIAQGYQTVASPAGPDGGVDILAGAGKLGFDEPRLCVQVKSSDSPVDATVLRSLQGTMRNFNATQGLLVAWGGFTSALIREARRLHFEVRLWDQGDVVANVLRHYEDLSPEMQADLPLKRIWMRVPEPEGEEH